LPAAWWTRRTLTIGFAAAGFHHPFFAEIAKAMAETVRPHGYHVIISTSGKSAVGEMKSESLLARQVDGLILASAQSGAKLSTASRIGTPLHPIDTPGRGVQACFVGVDNHAIGKLATTHLIDQGCCRIAHFAGAGNQHRDGAHGGLSPRSGETMHCKFPPGYVVDAGTRRNRVRSNA